MVNKAIDLIVDAISGGKKVLVFGVGGNAANAMHMAAELSGKYETYNECYPCFCLVDNPCEITAITNDFGWDHYFERQVLGKGSEGDVVVAFSISGSGKYLENGFKAAKEKGCKVVWICGQKNELSQYCDSVIDWCSKDTPRIQENQVVMLHHICGEVKKKLLVIEWRV